MSPESPAPRTLVLAFDTFGDLVLRQPLLTRLADDGHQLTVAVRRGYDRILPFLEPRAEPSTTEINPYTPGDERIWARVDELRAALLATGPEIVVSAPFNRTFLDEALLPSFTAARRYGFRRPSTRTGSDGAPLLTHEVDVVEESPEVEKNRALLEAISGRTEDLSPPRILLTEEARRESARILAEHGLEPSAFVLGCPAGTTVTALKAWPADDYLELVRHLHGKHRLPVLLTGVSAEEAHLRGIASAAAAEGIRAPVWIGTEETLGSFLGLIAASRLYLGSDSGPMHFAAALGVPVVVRFGGGHWRRFLPSAARGLVATQQLPCFGCNWECWLDHPACIHAASTETIRDGIDRLLSADREPLRVDMGAPVNGLAERLIGEGSRRYRRAASDLRSARSSLEGERAFRTSVQVQLEASEKDRAARLEHIHWLEARLEESEKDRAARLEYIHHLQRQARELEQAIEILRGHVESLAGQVAYLSTPSGALRVIGGAGLQKVGLFEVARRHRGLLQRLVPLKAPPRTVAVAPAAPPTPEEEARPSLLEAFVVGRSLAGDTDDRALERLYHLGARLRDVLCVHASPRNVQAAYMLACGGARVTVLGSPDVMEGLSVTGLAVTPGALGDWLVSRAGSLAPCDGVLLDAESAEADATLLHGRLSPGCALIVNGPGAEADGLSVTCPAPAPWLDPLAAGTVPPKALPSGRPWPRISVVTATLNQGAFLEETLRSVLGQAYPDLEYIVVDGGSTDETPAILERYRDRLSHCLVGPDEGQADALNKGFALATGAILAWLNSDDRYPAGALWRAALAFDAYGADVIVGGCALVQDEADEVLAVHHPALPVGHAVDLPLGRLLDIDGSWTKGDFFYQPEVFWTRDIWQKAGGRVAKDLYYSMDYELWLRMAESGARIVHVPDTLAVYRMHQGQKTAGAELPYVPELRQVASRHRAGSAAR
jgi:ADP-heptose:LPS heptosyltransferase/GT2 family glycosyltransferase